MSGPEPASKWDRTRWFVLLVSILIGWTFGHFDIPTRWITTELTAGTSLLELLRL